VVEHAVDQTPLAKNRVRRAAWLQVTERVAANKSLPK
jgi:hypothetical protein